MDASTHTHRLFWLGRGVSYERDCSRAFFFAFSPTKVGLANNDSIEFRSLPALVVPCKAPPPHPFAKGRCQACSDGGRSMPLTFTGVAVGTSFDVSTNGRTRTRRSIWLNATAQKCPRPLARFSARARCFTQAFHYHASKTGRPTNGAMGGGWREVGSAPPLSQGYGYGICLGGKKCCSSAWRHPSDVR